jgi:hypothetical protein
VIRGRASLKASERFPLVSIQNETQSLLSLVTLPSEGGPGRERHHQVIQGLRTRPLASSIA